MELRDSVGIPSVAVHGPLEKRLAQIDQIWKESEKRKEKRAKKDKKKPSEREIVSIEIVLKSVIDLISPKIVAQKIKLNIKQGKGKKAYSCQESLEQAFYRVFVDLLQDFDVKTPSRFISVHVKEFGEILWVDFFSSGGCFKKNPQNLELKIAETLLKECEGDFSFENAKDPKSGILGKKVRISLMAPRKKRRDIFSSELISA